MNKLFLTAAGAATMLVSMTAFPTVAFAQAGTLSITIYGNDPCPAQNICVRAPESQRYRLPQSQNPQGTIQQRQSWARQSQALRTVGNTGAGSCSAVGPGGWTGCLTQEINQAKQVARQQKEADQPPQ